MRALACFLFGGALMLASCGILTAPVRWFGGTTESSSREGATAASAVVDSWTDFFWYGVLGLIFLSLFFKDVREPIGQALSAFFGVWSALWARVRAAITRDPND